MSKRKHHTFFSHTRLPSFAHHKTSQLVKELGGPTMLSEGFLFHLWQQTAMLVPQEMKHVDIGRLPGDEHDNVLKLTVLGADQRAGWDVFMLGMPPAIKKGEAVYICMAHKAGQMRYFVLERGRKPDQVQLAEINADGKRVSKPAPPGIDLTAFLEAVGREVGFDVPAGSGVLDDAPYDSIHNRTTRASSNPQGSSKGWIGKVGCAVLVALALGVMGLVGYGFYLEFVMDLREPGTVVKTVKVKPDKNIKTGFVWDGVGYAFHDAWLEVEGTTDKDLFFLKGKWGCERGSKADTDKISMDLYALSGVRRVEKLGKGRFKAWFKIGDTYDRSSKRPISCRGRLDAGMGKIRKARLHITRTQRPSDFFAF